MLTNAKINLTKYTIFSSVLLVAIYFLALNNTEVKVMLVIFCAACINQWMLVNVVRAASQNAASGTPVNKFNMVAMVIGKIFLLIAALSFGVQIIGNRIIIPVVIYVLQIIVLYLSFDGYKSEN